MEWQIVVPIVVSVVALVLSGAAAWATFYGPQRAAEIAENLRVGSGKAEKRENVRTLIFFQLMQERAAPYTLDATKAFNLIDVAFLGCEPVHEAWRLYFASLDPNRNASLETKRELFHKLLSAMATEIGLGGVKMSEIDRIYSPEFVVKKLAIETMQMKLQEGTLKQALTAASANTTPQLS